MPDRNKLTIIGLGPGAYEQLTLEAHRVLSATDSILVRTGRHPTVDAIRTELPRLQVRTLDHLYETLPSFEDVYGAVVAHVMDELRDHDVVYAVPGSPSVDEATVALLHELCSAHGITLRLVQGLSYLEPVLAAVPGIDRTWLTVADGIELDLIASQNALGELPGKPGRLPIRPASPSLGILISQVYDQQLAAGVKLWLGRFWPDDHVVSVVRSAGTGRQSVVQMPIHKLDRSEYDHLTAIVVPPLDTLKDTRTLTGLLNVTQALRAPGGCPWDREQSHDTLKTHLLEESYEVIDALDDHDWDKLCGELGDLLFQITIHAQLAAEAGEFDVADVIAAITEKLIRRHPHVFGDAAVLASSAAVLERWETLKQAEMPERISVLSGIPLATPALPYSYAVQKRAGHQGFEWPTVSALLDKVVEEIDELRRALNQNESQARLREELGDIIFAMVSAGRWLKVDPEEALRFANRKFVTRFQHVEATVRGENRTLRDLSPDELDDLWNQAKSALESDSDSG